MDGIDATAAILRESVALDTATPPRIVMLTTFDLDEAAARAIRGGASGFLLKDAEPEFLLAAVRTVHAGNSVIAASATWQLFEHFRQGRAAASAPPSWGRLTDREDAHQPDPHEVGVA